MTLSLWPGSHPAGNKPLSCPDAESLALYIDGRASEPESAAIEAHIAYCEDCLAVFSGTALDRRHEADDRNKGTDTGGDGWRPRRLVLSGLAAVAAILLAVIFLPRTDLSQNQELEVAVHGLDSALGPFRRVEPRLSADLTYRGVAQVTRSTPAAADVPSESAPSVQQAARQVEAAASRAQDQDAARRALGLTYLRLGDVRRGLDALTPLAQSQDAGVLSDVAAAHLARQADGDARYARDLLERAVSLDPQSAAAWFNLGLAAESDGQTSRAIEAWTRASKLDASSGWAGEARAHLEKLTTR